MLILMAVLAVFLCACVADVSPVVDDYLGLRFTIYRASPRPVIRPVPIQPSDEDDEEDDD